MRGARDVGSASRWVEDGARARTHARTHLGEGGRAESEREGGRAGGEREGRQKGGVLSQPSSEARLRCVLVVSHIYGGSGGGGGGGGGGGADACRATGRRGRGRRGRSRRRAWAAGPSPRRRRSRRGAGCPSRAGTATCDDPPPTHPTPPRPPGAVAAGPCARTHAPAPADRREGPEMRASPATIRVCLAQADGRAARAFRRTIGGTIEFRADRARPAGAGRLREEPDGAGWSGACMRLETRAGASIFAAAGIM